MDTDHGPLEVLHVTLRDFIVDRSSRTPRTEKFYLSDHLHNDVLAWLCLESLNKDLNADTPGLELWRNRTPYTELSRLSNGEIPDGLYYACRNWCSHVVNVERPTSDMLDALYEFTIRHCKMWMEIALPMRKLGPVEQWWLWVHEHMPKEKAMALEKPVFGREWEPELLKSDMRMVDVILEDEALPSVRFMGMFCVEHPMVLKSGPRMDSLLTRALSTARTALRHQITHDYQRDRAAREARGGVIPEGEDDWRKYFYRNHAEGSLLFRNTLITQGRA
ncbi:hypothetical protein CALCODRAFT_254784 [Calocera cornea HHB12733]|uniref:Uncharacterized protein n=1 Tax=Calocera cornea HHB12733 TaxID=1353952 RepID=A0A165GN12_9BASI|nr:hypothetical protein CALCODRAFT_254784 [Calocera cornea HHB12733]